MNHPNRTAAVIAAVLVVCAAALGAGLFLNDADDMSAPRTGHDHHDQQAGHTAGPFRMRIVPDQPPLQAGDNPLTVHVEDSNGQPVNDAQVRVLAELRADAGDAGKSPAVTLAAAGEGRYRGTLPLPRDGKYSLAVDADAPDLGHGDLVLRFRTGETGLVAATSTPEGIAHYTCSMHPSVREAEPGQCPICGMDLIAVGREEVESGVITLDARRRQLIGVETGRAQRRSLSKVIRAVGEVDFDERHMTSVTLKFDGWIDDLQADFVGKRVERGQRLFSVYSPDLLSAQQEYLETRQRLSRRGPDDSLIEAARQRLRLWEIAPAQITALERRGQPLENLPIQSPVSGTVVEKHVDNGSQARAGETLLRIADLSTVWIDAEVYESDLPLIAEGMEATVTLPYLPDRTYRARVDYIYPYLDDRTRTARIRLALDNPEGTLKPDMYAEVRLEADLGDRLVVPEEAVLVAGESRVVFKDLGDDGKLRPVRVRTGQRADGFIEITEGLEPGDAVITSGNFLIAAEAKLRTGMDQW
ncbi:MAG: efflux RND transporter periplasmic adaptor subunit [Salinisphaeraceae bacterium]